ncbi:hypothetical protein [Agathobaculum sp.]|uniref:hypothetical protein n=1 Tax=Agathobaculum sp. TaxID=2048138 RepID=UPI002A83FB74|nr:hypothetical protein [Agathobaculum sp.]MDY3617431.1 hypothetical protein [Agathobaculum sp.]
MQESHRKALLEVDSYGCLFMYATHKDLTTSPRHIIRMTEPVDPAVLLDALKTALIRFPQFGLGLTRGDKRYAYRLLDKPPVVLPMDDRSPYYMGSEDTNGYLFLCGYRDSTIYLEYHHCTSDGRGFDQFIRCVLFYYLRFMGHPVENDGSIRTLETEFTPLDCEDGYLLLRGMPQSDADHHEDIPSFHLPQFDSENDDDELTTELTLSLSDVLDYTRTHGVTPVTFLMTALSMGMYRTYYEGTGRKEPIIAEIPMDLHAYTKTPTTRFFLSLLDLPFFYEYFSLPFVDACKACKAYFDTQRSLPHAVYWALKNARRVAAAHKSGETTVGEKERLMRQQARDYIRRDSFILTNVGAFKLPSSMEPFVDDYAAILPCAFQPFGVLVSSYRDTLKVSLSQRDFNYKLVENVRAVLRENGFETTALPYTFHVTRYDGLHLAK